MEDDVIVHPSTVWFKSNDSFFHSFKQIGNLLRNSELLVLRVEISTISTVNRGATYYTDVCRDVVVLALIVNRPEGRRRKKKKEVVYYLVKYF